jgi:two-component system, LytTR family, sensor kinase
VNAGSKRLLWYALFWGIVIVLALAGGYFNSILLDTPFQMRRELPFTARWMVWMPLTPLAVHFAGKMNYDDSKAVNFFGYHFLIYLFLCTLHIFGASLTAKLINELLSQPAEYIVILKKCALTGVFFNFVIYSIIVLIINGMAHYRALQQEKLRISSLEKAIAESRLQFLKQQLQPHFLFNTHHSIITLIRMGEKEKATAMLEKLSDLMRIALKDADEQVVPLSREIETLKLYVDIQKVRFEDKMNVLYNIEANANNALVPNMLLQPLVENSIKYAVERSRGQSDIVINASNTDELLTLSVTDTGSNNNTKRHITKGTGLSNSIERLRNLYGEASTFSIGPYANGAHSGMEVRITIPLEYATV